MCASVPPVAIFAGVYGHFAEKIAKQHQDALAEAGRVSSESLQSIRTVRSFALGDERERARYAS